MAQVSKELLGFIGTIITIIVSVALSTYTLIQTRRHDEEGRRLDESERDLVPRAQIDIECQFFSAEQGHIATEVKIIVENKGQALIRYSRVFLRILGIRSGEKLAPHGAWTESSCRLGFPEALVKEELLRNEPGSDLYTYTVEPGVRQVFTFPTTIPEGMKYVLVHARLMAKQDPSVSRVADPGEFREERMFAVAPS